MGRTSGYIQITNIAGHCHVRGSLHEIGHLIGFWHEQDRPYRHRYIKIHWENIKPGNEEAFRPIYAINSLGVTYDFNSVMQYRAKAFSVTGKATMTAIEKGLTIGGALELTPLDIKQTNLLYKHQCS